MMVPLLFIVLALCRKGSVESFISLQTRNLSMQTMTHRFMTTQDASDVEDNNSGSRRVFIHQVTRHAFLIPVVAATMATTVEPANADVSDGTSLPKAAQQFARVIKLKTDLKVCV